MCLTGNFTQRRTKGFMEKEVFYKVLDELAEHCTPLRFIRWGEPFTHPDILEFLRAAADCSLFTHANTTGSKFEDDILGALPLCANCYVTHDLLLPAGTEKSKD